MPYWGNKHHTHAVISFADDGWELLIGSDVLLSSLYASESIFEYQMVAIYGPVCDIY